MPRPRRLAPVAALAFLLATCEASGPPSGEVPAAPPGASPAEEPEQGPVVARVGGREIRLSELNERLRDELFEREMGGLSPSERFERQSQTLARMVEQIVLENAAAERGQSLDQLLTAELAQRGGVPDAQVTAFFEQNRPRLPQDQTLEELTPAIRDFLEQQKLAQIRSELRQQAAVEVFLQPPRVTVSGRGHARGPDAAPVSIVEFSDYQCPFCRNAEPTVEALLQRYPEQVRLEYRHLPLEQIHPQARNAAVAAICADAQGRFWDYHRKLFENQQALGDADLARYAGELGLDAAAFESCRQSEEPGKRIDADVQAAQAAGIDGTPAFLVNGILISGARPLEDFVRLIEHELAQAG